MARADVRSQNNINLPPPTEKTKVFLSYSRKDSALMQRIAEALIQSKHFEADFDKADHDPDRVSSGISADEPWWQRLEQMIARAEAMVFLVSPHSAASKVCDEEIAYAQRLGKRIIPVVVEAVDFAKLPPKLHSLNIAIDFTSTSPGFDEAMAQLIRALSINTAWLREGRRYAERAADWERKGRPTSDLLSQGALEELEAWSARRPKNEPLPTVLLSSWIGASRRRTRENMAKERQQIRRTRQWQVAAASILLLVFGGVLLGAWNLAIGERRLNRFYAENLLEESRNALAEGQTGRALRLAILASKDGMLTPTTEEAPQQLKTTSENIEWGVKLEGHTDDIRSATFSPDGNFILSPSEDNTARIWLEGNNGSWTSSMLAGHTDIVTDANFSPNGDRIVTASYDKTVRIWQRNQNGDWTDQIVAAHDDLVTMAVFVLSGTSIATVSTDNFVHIWNESENGSWLHVELEGHTDSITSIAPLPWGRKFVTTSNDGTARVWWHDGERGWSSEVLEDQPYPLNAADISSDGRRIVTASFGVARIWQESTEGNWTSTDIQRPTDEYGFVSVRFSQDGKSLITAHYDSPFLIWREDKDGNWSSRRLGPEWNRFSSASFSPITDTKVVTVSGRQGAHSWYLADHPREAAQQYSDAKEIDKQRAAACAFAAHPKVDLENGGLTALPIIDETDLSAAPLLRTIGYKAGDNVCEASKPKGIDALLTRTIPRTWWSGMDWDD